jgi:curved DNA-binding protein CbpA
MDGRFQVDRGCGAATPEGFEAVAAAEPKRQGWQFVDEFQRLVGEEAEPDARFFVESWTSGTAAAVGSYKQRRQSERVKDVFRRSSYADTASFMRERAIYAEFAALASAPVNAGYAEVGRLADGSEEAVARTQDEAWQDWERVAGQSGGAIYPMTREYACLLLGVTEANTRQQIKAAYRKLVSRWHPDRLGLEAEGTRRLANERMAAINEAYHLLMSGLR